MVVAYPVIIKRTPIGLKGFFPDIPGLEFACDKKRYVEFVARDALQHYVITRIATGKELPPASKLDEYLSKPNKFLCIAKCEIPEINGKFVTRTMMIPEWIHELAVKNDLDLAKIFEEAIYAKLGIYKTPDFANIVEAKED